MTTSHPAEQPLSVSELTDAIKALLDEAIGRVWVEGEISNLRRQPSGHIYFTLKDSGAQISAVMFQGQASRLTFIPADGAKVRASGEVSVYKQRGQYQIVVSRLAPAGQGDLLKKFEELKARLMAEGLFDSARKKKIPRHPASILLLTSQSGAALRDMLTVLARRAPHLRVAVYPVRVQGAEAPPEIVAALDRIASWHRRGLYSPDAILLARGGGSIEDLYCFNDEALARAIAACPVPTISGIGHETDFTIADFVADLRAPTPSAAAEIAAGSRDETLDAIREAHGRIARATANHISGLRLEIKNLAGRAVFREPARIIQAFSQRIDDVFERLDRAASVSLQTKKNRLERLGRTTATPQLPTRAIALARERMLNLCARMDLLNPRHTVQRGYAIARSPDGAILRSARDLPPATPFTLELADGTIHARTEPGNAP